MLEPDPTAIPVPTAHTAKPSAMTTNGRARFRHDSVDVADERIRPAQIRPERRLMRLHFLDKPSGTVGS